MIKLIIITLILSAAAFSFGQQECEFNWGKSLISGSFKNEHDYLQEIKTDNDGNFYVAGTFLYGIDLAPDSTKNVLMSKGADGFIAKYSPAMELIWSAALGHTNADQITGFDLDDEGNVLICGEFTGTTNFDPQEAASDFHTSNGDFDIFVAKLSPEGEYLWSFSIGAAESDHSCDIHARPDGSFVLTGQYSGTVDFDPGTGVSNGIHAGNDEIFLSSYSANGAFLWNRTIGGPTQQFAVASAVSPAGLIAFTGHVNGAPFITFYNADGTFVSSANIDMAPQSVQFDDGSNFYMTGYYSQASNFSITSGNFMYGANYDTQAFFTAKYNPALQPSWVKGPQGQEGLFGSSDSRDLSTDTDGNVYITGTYDGYLDFDPGENELFLSSYDAVFLLKYDATGAVQWAKSFGDMNPMWTGEVAALSNTGVIYGGMFQSDFDADASSGTSTLTAYSTSRDIYLLKYNGAGNYEDAGALGGDLNSFGEVINSSMISNRENSIITTGYFNGGIYFDPSVPETLVENPAYPGTSSYLTCHDTSGTLLWGRVLSNSIAYSSVSDPAGNIYVTGTFLDSLVYYGSDDTLLAYSPNYQRDLFLLKLTPDGDLIWCKTFGGPANDIATLLFSGGDEGQIVVSGQFTDSINLNPEGAPELLYAALGSSFLSWFDEDGNFIRSRQISGGLNLLSGLINDQNELIFCAGYNEPVILYSPAGNVQLTSNGTYRSAILSYSPSAAPSIKMTSGGTGYCAIYDIVESQPAGYVICGQCNGNVTIGGEDLTGNEDIFYSKLSETFVPEVTGTVNAEGDGMATEASVTSSGDIYLSGRYEGSLDDSHPESSPNVWSTFIMKINPDGTYGAGVHIGRLSLNDMITTEESLILSGGFTGHVDLDPAPASFYPAYDFYQDAFLGSYSHFEGNNGEENLNVPENTTVKQIVFPNPNDGSFSILSETDGWYTVSGVSGRKISSFYLTGPDKHFLINESAAPGIYLLHCPDGATVKFIIR